MFRVHQLTVRFLYSNINLMKVYLDNCAYNRPFDDQRNIIVRLETKAKLAIQQMIKDNEMILREPFDYTEW